MMPDINFVLSAIVMALYCGFQSAANVTNFQNVHDLAPNFVGSLFAFISAPASATGVLSQFVLGEVLAVAGVSHMSFLKPRDGVTNCLRVLIVISGHPLCLGHRLPHNGNPVAALGGRLLVLWIWRGPTVE